MRTFLAVLTIGSMLVSQLGPGGWAAAQAAPTPPTVPALPEVPAAPTAPAPSTVSGDQTIPAGNAPPVVEQLDAGVTAQWSHANWAELMSAASLYASKGRRMPAKQLFSMALRAAEKDPGPDKQREMFTYEGLADLTARMGSFAEAETYLKSAIACDPAGQRKELRKKMVSVCKELNKSPETEIQVAGQQSRVFYSSPEYGRYAAAVTSACAKTWKPPYAIDPMPLTVVFWIEPDGTAREIFIQQSSGHRRLDQSLVQAVLQQRQLPPAPEGAPKRMFMQIHWAPEGMSEEQKAIRGRLWGF